MFSFTKIATFAALAFGVLASALPQPATFPETDALAARQSGTDLTTILNNLNNALKAPISQLNALSASAATADNVQPIVANIQNLVQTAVNGGKSKSLGSGNVLVLTSTTLNNVVTAFGRVYNLQGVDQDSLQPVFQASDTALAALVTTVIGLVGGLLTIVFELLEGLLEGLVGTLIAELGLSALSSALGL